LDSPLRLKASEVDATLAATTAKIATLYPRRNIIVATFDKHNDLNRVLIVVFCETSANALDYGFQLVTQRLWLMTTTLVDDVQYKHGSQTRLISGRYRRTRHYCDRSFQH
jgi:hypothetical protein